MPKVMKSPALKWSPFRENVVGVWDDAIPGVDDVNDWLRHEAPFRVERHGGTPFTIARLTPFIERLVYRSVQACLGVSSLEDAMTFARLSTDAIDADVRIHTDAMMGGTHAWVWSPTDGQTPAIRGSYPSGTAFFEHWKHGSGLRFTPETQDEHARLLNEDAADLRCWTLDTVAPLKANRLTVYPSHLFHSRWPFEGWGSSPADGRVVIVGFGTPVLGDPDD